MRCSINAGMSKMGKEEGTEKVSRYLYTFRSLRGKVLEGEQKPLLLCGLLELVDDPHLSVVDVRRRNRAGNNKGRATTRQVT